MHARHLHARFPKERLAGGGNEVSGTGFLADAGTCTYTCKGICICLNRLVWGFGHGNLQARARCSTVFPFNKMQAKQDHQTQFCNSFVLYVQVWSLRGCSVLLKLFFRRTTGKLPQLPQPRDLSVPPRWQVVVHSHTKQETRPHLTNSHCY